MAVIILTVLNVVLLFLVLMGIVRRARDIRNITDLVVALKNGDDPENVKTSIHCVELRDILMETFGSISHMLDLQKESMSRSERSGMRLSRNIEKAVVSASRISKNTEANRQSAHRLSDSVSSGSAAVEQIHASLRSFRSLNDRQNGSIENTAASIEAIDRSIRKVSGIASDRLESVENLRNVTAEGSEKIQENEEVIRNIQKQVDDVLSLITVINEIADQTNLLSMNAAIEAAHAGEAGKGFAVVAEEIRSLAESTGQNSLSIADTLNKLVEQINRAGTISRDSGASFKEIEDGALAVSEAFRDIHDDTEVLLASADELSASTRVLQEVAAETTSSVKEIELGTEDINNALLESKSIATGLDGSMEALAEDSRISNYNLTKVSDSYLKTSESFLEIIKASIDYRNDDDGLQDKLFISNLMIAHVNWMGLSRSFIDGKLDESEIDLKSDTRCRLGQWIQNDGEAFIGDTARFKRLKNRHHDLHGVVGDIVACKNKGDLNAAESHFTKLTEISNELVQMLMTLGYTDFVKWNPALSVRVDAFDEQHKKLLALIGELYSKMVDGSGKDVLLDILKKLIDYTGYHFATEEKNFKKYGYAEAEEHIFQHNSLVKKATDLYQGLEKGEGVLSIEVLDFLQNWVMNHIQKTDKKYSDFFEGKSVEK